MLHATIDGGGAYALPVQVVHLVLHQGYQGGDDYADTLHGHGRYLEGDALAASGGHQSQGVMTTAYRLDNLALYSAEIIVAPELLEK